MLAKEWNRREERRKCLLEREILSGLLWGGGAGRGVSIRFGGIRDLTRW